MTTVTTYTTDSHLHSTRTIQGKVLMRAAESSPALPSRAAPKTHARVEKFSCLESSDPNVQIRSALKQVESLLQQNSRLVQAVLSLDHALSEARFLIDQGGLMLEEDRDAFYLSPHFHLYIERLRKQL